MIYIIGETFRTYLLGQAATAAGHEVMLLCSVEDVQGDCDFAILDAQGDLASRQQEVAALTEKITAPIAVCIDLDYACALTKEAKKKSNVVAVRTMENEHIGEYIELTKTFDTDEATYEKVKEILKSFNGHVAEVPDVFGGIFYRIMPLVSNMGAFLVTEGVTVTDVDNSMRYGANIKRTPMQIADEYGVDRLLEILSAVYRETGRPAYRPCPLLKQMVNAGRLGKKSGQGFYKYD